MPKTLENGLEEISSSMVRHIISRTAAFVIRCCILALIVSVAWSSSAQTCTAMHITRMTVPPIEARITLGECIACYMRSSNEYEASIASLVDQVEQIIETYPNRIVVLELIDYPLSFENFADAEKKDITDALKADDHAARRYERTIAHALGEVMSQAAATTGAIITIAGLPIEDREIGGASSSNARANYQSLIDELPLLSAGRLDLARPARNWPLAIADQFPNTVSAMASRGVLFIVDDQWHFATLRIVPNDSETKQVENESTAPDGDSSNGGTAGNELDDANQADSESSEDESGAITLRSTSEPEPVAEFVNPPSTFVIGASPFMKVRVLSGAPSQADVVFQTWSNSANALQAAHADHSPPFTYPAWKLNTVTPGNVEVQAIVRDASNQVIAIVRHPMVVTTSEPTPPPPPPPPGVARFVNPPAQFDLGSTTSLTLEMLADAPSNPNVVFQTWSNAASAIQGVHVDSTSPFVYPATSLNLVATGQAEVQALVRNGSNQVVAIIRHPISIVDSTPPQPPPPSEPPPPPPPPPSGTTPPAPVIQTISTTGMAPFTVHAHGLNSTLNAGTENTARYEWDFGDGTAPYNTLIGWNAAHTYNQPGTYTITLRIINESGGMATATRQITVTANTRSAIYVAPTGSDSNPGTQAAPIRTFDRAAQFLANNRAIYFQRGGTYDTASSMNISQQNVLIGAYGSGALPKLNFTSNANYVKFIQFTSSALNTVIENVRFDSNFAPNNMIVRAIQPAGTNLTVRNCEFNKISYAMNCGGGGVNGLLAQNNFATALGAYFVWGEGSNHAYLGNTVQNSIDEHNIRIGGVSRLLIAHNDLHNQSKATIWCMLGDHAYVAENILRTGRFIAGPNFAVSSPGERFPWLVFENNQIIDNGVILYSGAEYMMFRNNVITYPGGECFSIWGYVSDWNRTVRHVSIVNNTATNTVAQYGRFLKLGSGAEHITVANNLYCAPSFNGFGSAANAFLSGSMMSSYTFRNNLWANPASGSYVHVVQNAGKTVPQWSGYGQVNSESYRSFSGADLNSQFWPQFNANAGVAAPGVHRDFHGANRPLSGTVTIGAVQSY